METKLAILICASIFILLLSFNYIILKGAQYSDEIYEIKIGDLLQSESGEVYSIMLIQSGFDATKITLQDENGEIFTVYDFQLDDFKKIESTISE